MKSPHLIIIVIFLAIFVRLYKLDVYPPSLNWDEVSHGYNAFSILTTSRDEWGSFLPAIFRAFGDYKLPVYIYLTAPLIKIFGLTAYGVRLLSALAGVGSVVFTYLLAKKILKQEVSALISAFSLAISPWSIFLSRIAVEANLATLFIISGAYFFLLGVEQKQNLNSPSSQSGAQWGFLSLFKNKSWGFALSGFLFGLSLFTYNSARIFVPLLLGLLIWINRKILLKQGKNTCACHLVGLALFLFFFTGMVYQFVMPEGQARFDIISVLDQGTINRINESRGATTLPSPLPTLFYNKATFLIGRSFQNYFSFFNPNFWFFTGGDHYQFNLPNHGLLYQIELPFLLFGLLSLWKVQSSARWLILGWLLLAPIPASPTRDNPHTLRIITMMPIPYLLIGLGAHQIYQWSSTFAKIQSKTFALMLLCSYALMLAWPFSIYWRNYTTTYRANYAWSWQYGHQQMVEYLKQNYSEYSQIFVTKKYGEPHEFILFYWPWDPADYVKQKQWDYHDNWYWINGFDKFVFVNDWEVKNVQCSMSNVQCLLVTSPENVPDGWHLQNTVYDLNQQPVFEIYANQ